MPGTGVFRRFARAGGLDGQFEVHKGERERELVEGRGCETVFSRAYSPIEEVLSKIEALLGRTEAARGEPSSRRRSVGHWAR